jgi:hypothetical protein
VVSAVTVHNPRSMRDLRKLADQVADELARLRREFNEAVTGVPGRFADAAAAQQGIPKRKTYGAAIESFDAVSHALSQAETYVRDSTSVLNLIDTDKGVEW